MGAVFINDETASELPSITILLEDRDNSFVSRLFQGALSGGKLAKTFTAKPVEKNAGQELMNRGKASALLIIPEGFSDDFLTKRLINVKLVKNPSETFKPKIVEEFVTILCEAGTRFVYASEEPLAMASQSYNESTADLIAVKFSQLVRKASVYLNPPLIDLQTQEASESEVKSQQGQLKWGETIFNYFFIGMAVMWLLFIIDIAARDFFREKEGSTLFRIISGPVRIREYLLAKMFYLFLLGMIALLVLFLGSMIIYNIQPHSILTLGLFSIVVIASEVGIIMLIYALAKTRNQAGAIAPAVILPLSMVGGAMVPFEVLPEFIKRAGVFSPLYWSGDGLKKIILSQASFSSLELHFALLLGIALFLNILSYFIIKRRL